MTGIEMVMALVGLQLLLGLLAALVGLLLWWLERRVGHDQESVTPGPLERGWQQLLDSWRAWRALARKKG